MIIFVIVPKAIGGVILAAFVGERGKYIPLGGTGGPRHEETEVETMSILREQS